MNTANPFQIPECFQKADFQQRRRERFKRGVIAIVFAVMALLVVLLIQGCMSERAESTASGEVIFTPNAPAPVKNQSASAQSSVPTRLIADAQPPAPVVQNATSVDKPGATVYVVKSGDSLSRIAKLHGVTIKALKSANDLASDRIFVGDKLKIPQA